MKKKKYAALTVMLVAAVLVSGAAVAGTDATFGADTGGTGPLGMMTGWLTGSMGKMFAIGALAVGLGIGIVKQSVMSVAIGTGIALSASAGPAVLSSIFSATL
jgi:conjugal transfer pilus assembly protein TraA